jgi:hypothetical protein
LYDALIRKLIAAAGLAALVTLAAGATRAQASTAAPQAQLDQLVVVEQDKSDTTTVIVVERTPKVPDRAAEWAYPERGLVYYPAGPGAGKGRWAIGGIWMIAPMFTADYRHGLGAGFSLDARLKTIILYNQLGAGAQWAFQAGPFSLGLMAHVDGFFGTLGKAFLMKDEFNAMGWGVLVEPGVKAGLQVASNSWLTLQYEAYMAVYQAQSLGGTVISPGSGLYEGFGLTLNVEYSPKKQGVIYYGVALYNTRSNYPLWFNVDYSPAFIWYLGVQAGYEF